MIKIKNLTKIYNSDIPVVALDNVSIDLPSKGLVFIVGKSGSGKSTLLNILGCLDSLTEGSIIADNIEINCLNDEDAAKYRNEYVGFIFQDYCLLDNLTVKENINLAFNIQNKIDDVLVNETISMMGLEGLEDRLPKTLSAGQKQRVAIARGYIKKPKLLLCDEPTGNLDSKTSAQILGLLKELSFTTLVVIVSHNLDDAYNYADRIIEISDGKIIDDISDASNKKRYEIQDKKLYVSNIVSLSDEELNEINHELNKGNIKEISSKNNLFIESKELNEEVSSFELKDHHYSFKDKFKMSLKLQKKRVISSFIICLFSALIAVIFGLSQFFTMFDKNEVIKQSLENNNQSVFSMKKGYYDDAKQKNINLSSLISINDNDLNTIKESNYKGKTYSLYNYSLPVSLKYWTLQNEVPINNSLNLKDFFLQEIYGVLPVDESYLKQIFGEYTLTGSLSDKDYGIIITDYVADSILYYRSDTFSNYEQILGVYKNKSNSIYTHINGIIHTNYKTKFAKIISEFNKYREDPLNYDMNALILSEDYLNFYESVINYLGIAYSVNPNFMKASNNVLARNFVRFDDSRLTIDNNPIYVNGAFAFIDSLYIDVIGEKLPNYTLGISLSTLNNLLGTQLSYEEAKEYENKEITITRYHHHHNDDEALLVKKINIKVFDTGYFSYVVSEDLFTILREYDMIPYSLYFNDLKSASYAYYALEDKAFVPNSSYIDVGVSINNIVVIFNNFFVLIVTLLLGSIILILGFNCLNNILSNKYEIGVFKSLGMKEKDITWIFIYQIIISTIITSVLFGIGIVIFSNVANNLLFDSFMSYLKNPALNAVTIISFHPWVFLIDVLIILFINALITLIPFFFLKKIKPLNIVRNS